MPELPFSQACENNKDTILAVLKRAFGDSQNVVEIGSGTGQHAVYFAKQLPHCHWQPTDQAHYLPDLNLRLQQQGPDNLLPAQVFDVFAAPPVGQFDALFTANTCHIMPKAGVEKLFQHLNHGLASVKTLCIYGPFNDNGVFTSASNQAFDQHLKARDPQMGLRDKQWLEQLGNDVGFSLAGMHLMPANNMLLVMQRR
ncbi:methylase [Idiomarina tyrosinivorans]|uniref:Methylase n=1 Tax=Idiomarina tyrosinivorans TaxID=1445662 RepID=A0A432ZUK6_9GAMM|nr:DUF938 domain-containing protein [Idiomarina tyrosinivorans]RUO81541.1 methylase [Idiomarina tyrosinivorans]